MAAGTKVKRLNSDFTTIGLCALCKESLEIPNNIIIILEYHQIRTFLDHYYVGTYLSTVVSVFRSSSVTRSPLDTKLSDSVHGRDAFPLSVPWSHERGTRP